MSAAIVCAATELLVTLNVLLVLPAGIVTDAGMFTIVLLLCKLTTTPAAPAASLRVTVPVDTVPFELAPMTVEGESVKDVNRGTTSNIAFGVELPVL